MRRIFKYQLSLSAEINIVRGPIIRPLTIEMQNGAPCLWAVVETCLPDMEFEVTCVMTGQEMPDVSPGDYLNTTLLEDGQLVLHWFINATLRKEREHEDYQATI